MTEGGKSGRGTVVLGDAVRDGWLLRAYCGACGHHAAVRPAVVARSLGYDFPVAGLARRLKCSQCQGREVEIRVQTPDPGVVTRHGPDGGSGSA